MKRFICILVCIYALRPILSTFLTKKLTVSDGNSIFFKFEFHFCSIWCCCWAFRSLTRKELVEDIHLCVSHWMLYIFILFHFYPRCWGSACSFISKIYKSHNWSSLGTRSPSFAVYSSKKRLQKNKPNPNEHIEPEFCRFDIFVNLWSSPYWTLYCKASVKKEILWIITRKARRIHNQHLTGMRWPSIMSIEQPT